jgi:rod shape-determining protein MreD
MTGWLRTILIAWGTVFLQSSVIHLMGVYGNIPDLLAIAIAAKALKDGTAKGTSFGALIGFLADCYHPATMGLMALSGIAMGWLAGILRERIYREQLASQMALAGGLALLRQPFEFLGMSGGSLGGYPWFLLRYGLGSAAYTAALAFFVIPLLARWWTVKTGGKLAKSSRGILS